MNGVEKTASEFEFEEYTDYVTEEYHYHDRIEIIFVKEGHIRLRTNMSADVCDLYSGDYAIINSPDVHRVFYMKQSQVQKFRFPISYLNMLEGQLIEKSFVISKSVLGENKSIYDCVESIRLLVSKTTLNKQIVRNLCSSLYTVLLSFYSKRKIEQSADDDSSESFSSQNKISLETIEKFYKALNYTRINFTDSKVNLELLSSVSGLNKTFLSALFPKMTGRNFKDYINRLKVDKAIELLTTSEKRISDIAFLCGFETIRSLNNVFKSITGVTPSDMRLSAFGNSVDGIYTEIDGVGDGIFNYKWTSNVFLESNTEENELFVQRTDVNKKTWCHLILKMLFFPKREYNISFKAKLLDEFTADMKPKITCNFFFPDEISHIEHHGPLCTKKIKLQDGWYEFSFTYVMPDYYKTTSLDHFSIYTSPIDEKGISFRIKDISLKIV